MLFSKKIIIFLFLLSLKTFAQSSPIEAVELYKSALFIKDEQSLFKVSTKKHIKFLKKNKISKILKNTEFKKLKKDKDKIHETQSKVVKGSFQVIIEESKEHKEIYQIVKEKERFLIDRIVNDDSHDHH